jgi:hypothetical protein
MAETPDTAADWNVIVTLPEATFREARRFLHRWGDVHRTVYFHVLTLTVDDVESFLADIGKAVEEKPGTLNILSHMIPAQRAFNFASAEEFEARARDILGEPSPTRGEHRGAGFLGFAGVPENEPASGAARGYRGAAPRYPAQVADGDEDRVRRLREGRLDRAMAATENVSDESIVGDLAEEVDLHDKPMKGLYEIGTAAQSGSPA